MLWSLSAAQELVEVMMLGVRQCSFYFILCPKDETAKIKVDVES